MAGFYGLPLYAMAPQMTREDMRMVTPTGGRTATGSRSSGSKSGGDEVGKMLPGDAMDYQRLLTEIESVETSITNDMTQAMMDGTYSTPEEYLAANKDKQRAYMQVQQVKHNLPAYKVMAEHRRQLWDDAIKSGSMDQRANEYVIDSDGYILVKTKEGLQQVHESQFDPKQHSPMTHASYYNEIAQRSNFSVSDQGIRYNSNNMMPPLPEKRGNVVEYLRDEYEKLSKTLQEEGLSGQRLRNLTEEQYNRIAAKNPYLSGIDYTYADVMALTTKDYGSIGRKLLRNMSVMPEDVRVDYYTRKVMQGGKGRGENQSFDQDLISVAFADNAFDMMINVGREIDPGTRGITMDNLSEPKDYTFVADNIPGIVKGLDKGTIPRGDMANLFAPSNSSVNQRVSTAPFYHRQHEDIDEMLGGQPVRRGVSVMLPGGNVISSDQMMTNNINIIVDEITATFNDLHNPETGKKGEGYFATAYIPKKQLKDLDILINDLKGGSKSISAWKYYKRYKDSESIEGKKVQEKIISTHGRVNTVNISPNYVMIHLAVFDDIIHRTFNQYSSGKDRQAQTVIENRGGR